MFRSYDDSPDLYGSVESEYLWDFFVRTVVHCTTYPLTKMIQMYKHVHSIGPIKLYKITIVMITYTIMGSANVCKHAVRIMNTLLSIFNDIIMCYLPSLTLHFFACSAILRARIRKS